MANGKKWASLPTKEQDRLAKMYAAGNDLAAEADRLDMNEETLSRQIRSYNYYKRKFLGERAEAVYIPPSRSKTYLDYEVIETDNALVISDIEFPDHDPVMLRLALLTAINRGIKTCIINGDLIATDQAALNEWVATLKNGDEQRYEDVVDAVHLTLAEFSEWFDQIVIDEGNHDDRIARKTGGEVHLGMFLRDLDKVRYSRYSYLYIQTSTRGLIKCVHPQNFSADPVTLGQSLYNVERGPRFDALRPFTTLQKCHFIVAHCHRQQSGMSPDGAYEIHSSGTMRDATRTQYKNQHANKYKQWDSGFHIIEDGFIYPLTLTGTNWRRELGSLYAADLFVKE